MRHPQREWEPEVMGAIRLEWILLVTALTAGTQVPQWLCRHAPRIRVSDKAVRHTGSRC